MLRASTGRAFADSKCAPSLVFAGGTTEGFVEGAAEGEEGIVAARLGDFGDAERALMQKPGRLPQSHLTDIRAEAHVQRFLEDVAQVAGGVADRTGQLMDSEGAGDVEM